jgi:hypothetical protein
MAVTACQQGNTKKVAMTVTAIYKEETPAQRPGLESRTPVWLKTVAGPGRISSDLCLPLGADKDKPHSERPKGRLPWPVRATK